MKVDQGGGGAFHAAAQAERIFSGLGRVQRAISVHARSVGKSAGLSASQLAVLRACQRLGEVTSRRLADDVQLSQGTISVVIDRLEGSGLVSRYRSPRDRRIVHVRLTDRGRQAVETASPPIWQQFVEHFSSLPPERQNEMADAIEELVALIETAPKQAWEKALAAKSRETEDR